MLPSNRFEDSPTLVDTKLSLCYTTNVSSVRGGQSMTSTNHILFYEESLDDQLKARLAQASNLIDKIPQDQFLISTDEQVIANIQPQLRVEPVELCEEARSMQQQECQVDISRNFSRRLWHDERQGPFYIPGTKIIISTPFTGEAWIFRYRTAEYWSVFPRADVQSGKVLITIEQPHDTDQEEFKRVFDSEIQRIREYLEKARKQVETYNQRLPSLIQVAVSNRRQRLEQHKGLSDLLGIPLQSKSGVPSLNPVRVEVRPLPKLPTPPKTGLRPEPGILLETYELILNVIRHEVRTYETTPDTYAKLEEEELRNVLLAHLNTYFQGRAAGETFRRSGKTDICIQEENRSAFVGECKVWRGVGQIPSALDQLLNYLTWRDSKAALIIFNKTVSSFSTILENLPKAISEHQCFIRSLDCEQAGEWRVLMRSTEDEGRLVTIHVFAINIFTNKHNP